MTTEERAVPCFVRHEDAGGQCSRPASVRVHGLAFCAEHGEEARLGASLEEHEDAAHFFERFQNPHVPDLNDLIDRELEGARQRLNDEAPSDRAYHEALVRAYNADAPEDLRERVHEWILDEEPGVETVVDYLLRALALLHKLIRIAHNEPATWLVEILEERRQSEAVQAAVALAHAERRA